LVIEEVIFFLKIAFNDGNLLLHHDLVLLGQLLIKGFLGLNRRWLLMLRS
jgi:hypothetical protein